MKHAISFETEPTRALERQADELLKQAGCGKDGLKFDLERQKELVAYERRTIYTPCGGLKRKPR